MSPTIPLSSLAFLLVASFGRSAVRLNEDFVGLILQASLGGIAKDFNVSHLSGWMFSFTVSCKNVGFMVHNLKRFSCKTFDIFFHLWGGGGPNWCRDFSLWCSKQEAEWTTVGPKFKKSFAEIVKSSGKVPLKPKKLVFVRLSYPKNYYRSFFSQPQ